MLLRVTLRNWKVHNSCFCLRCFKMSFPTPRIFSRFYKKRDWTLHTAIQRCKKWTISAKSLRNDEAFERIWESHLHQVIMRKHNLSVREETLEAMSRLKVWTGGDDKFLIISLNKLPLRLFALLSCFILRKLLSPVTVFQKLPFLLGFRPMVDTFEVPNWKLSCEPFISLMIWVISFPMKSCKCSLHLDFAQPCHKLSGSAN